LGNSNPCSSAASTSSGVRPLRTILPSSSRRGKEKIDWKIIKKNHRPSENGADCRFLRVLNSELRPLPHSHTTAIPSVPLRTQHAPHSDQCKPPPSPGHRAFPEPTYIPWPCRCASIGRERLRRPPSCAATPPALSSHFSLQLPEEYAASPRKWLKKPKANSGARSGAKG